MKALKSLSKGFKQRGLFFKELQFKINYSIEFKNLIAYRRGGRSVMHSPAVLVSSGSTEVFAIRF
jgi:hypothetical protein